MNIEVSENSDIEWGKIERGEGRAGRGRSQMSEDRDRTILGVPFFP